MNFVWHLVYCAKTALILVCGVLPDLNLLVQIILVKLNVVLLNIMMAVLRNANHVTNLCAMDVLVLIQFVLPANLDKYYLDQIALLLVLLDTIIILIYVNNVIGVVKIVKEMGQVLTVHNAGIMLICLEAHVFKIVLMVLMVILQH